VSIDARVKPFKGGHFVPTGPQNLFLLNMWELSNPAFLRVQGREVAIFEPNALANHDLAVSNDGRFIAAATFSSDVKIWEMKYTREGEFRGGWTCWSRQQTGHICCFLPGKQRRRRRGAPRAEHGGRIIGVSRSRVIPALEPRDRTLGGSVTLNRRDKFGLCMYVPAALPGGHSRIGPQRPLRYRSRPRPSSPAARGTLPTRLFDPHPPVTDFAGSPGPWRCRPAQGDGAERPPQPGGVRGAVVGQLQGGHRQQGRHAQGVDLIWECRGNTGRRMGCRVGLQLGRNARRCFGSVEVGGLHMC
jgi:hypothetical protein